MTECRNCGGRAGDAFLCRHCETNLKRALGDLPTWLNWLTDAALGRTRMSDNAGRKSARRKDLDGDLELAACIEKLPNVKDDDLDKARRERQRHALAHALATGGVNARASELLSEIDDALAFWCRVLCEARGLTYAPGRAGIALGANHAVWLWANVAAVSQCEDAADIVTEIVMRTDEIRTDINRPIRWWPLGDCPGTTDEDEPCRNTLRVPEHTDEVRCRKCGTTHNVHRLILARKADAESGPMRWRELNRYNRALPPEFQVPQRTLREWLARGRLAPCGADPEGDPLYSWVDVRLLMLDSKHASVTQRA